MEDALKVMRCLMDQRVSNCTTITLLWALGGVLATLMDDHSCFEDVRFDPDMDTIKPYKSWNSYNLGIGVRRK
ncbi:S2-RNase [Pyrus ussuriensis x Pyrus communis]|uniref:S2-RNase n=1 Tax=Pyrus ussuriensis x Pyrus communis TaxID=2448454 RepID=A0A5N5GMZ9_9ROSA|nr:S2-RNase [Pyrus ussuriensis x Pyrus communis]